MSDEGTLGPLVPISLYKEALRERDEWREKAQRRCGTCAYLTLPESAGKQWCEKLERFVSLQFGCADWRPTRSSLGGRDA